jgi:hypothetical protein
MTVIVWDGRMLAADRMASHYGTPMRVTKIAGKREGSRMRLVGASGAAALATALRQWALGAGLNDDPYQSTFPQENRQHADQFATVIVVDLHVEMTGMARPTKLRYWEREPYPVVFDPDQPFACGIGADFALGAIAAGRDALDAVQAATMFSTNVGLGANVIDCDTSRWPASTSGVHIQRYDPQALATRFERGGTP